MNISSLEIKYKDDTSVVYMCGCSESRMEYPEYWKKLCKDHEETKRLVDFHMRNNGGN